MTLSFTTPFAEYVLYICLVHADAAAAGDWEVLCRSATASAAAASQLASPPAAISTDPALLVINPPADLQPLPSPTLSPRGNGPASAADAINVISISPSTFVQAEPESAGGGATATQGAAMSADPASGTPPLALFPVVALTCIMELALAVLAMMELAVPVQTMVVLTAWLELGLLA